MNWTKDFSSNEFFFIAAFMLIYLIYFIRIFIISRKLKTSTNFGLVKFILRIVYLALMIIALLGPNFGITEMEARSTGKDIYIGFDLSESMNAQDVEPSRLDKAKNELKNFVDQYKADKIGLMIFNSEASLMTPLTFDHEIIKSDINSLTTSTLGSGGTDYNSILGLVYEKFNTNKSDETQSKIFVLVTDGENFENLDPQWEKLFKILKINLFVIGIGTNSGSKIPKFSGFKKDSDGNEVVSILDIKQIAEITKNFEGEYFVINNQSNQIGKLQDQINLVKKSENTGKQQLVTYNKYIHFLLLALLFISIDFLVDINVIKL